MSEGFNCPHIKSSFNTFILIFEQKTSSKSIGGPQVRKRRGRVWLRLAFRSENKRTTRGVHVGWMTFFLGKARLANSKCKLRNSLKEMMKQQPNRAVQSIVKVKSVLLLEETFFVDPLKS